MNIKILDSILHGELKPWKVDASNTRHFADLIKTAKTDTPETKSELTQKLAALLVDCPALLSSIKKEPGTNNQELQQLPFSADLPTYKDAITQYYFMLINHEALHYYNNVFEQSAGWTDHIDLNYQTKKIFTSLVVLAKQTSEELSERNYSLIPDGKSDLTNLVLYYLKQTLIILHQSLQLKFEDRLEQTTSLEELYLLELEEPQENIITLTSITSLTKKREAKKQNARKLAFGFHNDKAKLRAVINQLCIQIELLNEEISPADELLKILLAKEIIPGNITIRLNCDNKNFRYVVEKLIPFFNTLSFINIEHTKSFYSKRGTLLKANDFSKAKTYDPKEKATIDNIFKQMQ